MGRTQATLAAVASSSGSVNGSCFSLGKPIGLPPTVFHQSRWRRASYRTMTRMQAWFLIDARPKAAN